MTKMDKAKREGIQAALDVVRDLFNKEMARFVANQSSGNHEAAHYYDTRASALAGAEVKIRALLTPAAPTRQDEGGAR